MKYNVDKLTPAPLNQKDVLEDLLFEQILDDFESYVERGNEVLGWINGVPVLIEWKFNSNRIVVTPIKIKNNTSYTAEMIVLRLEKYNDEPDTQVICDAIELAEESLKIEAYYYYKPETRGGLTMENVYKLLGLSCAQESLIDEFQKMCKKLREANIGIVVSMNGDCFAYNNKAVDTFDTVPEGHYYGCEKFEVDASKLTGVCTCGAITAVEYKEDTIYEVAIDEQEN